MVLCGTGAEPGGGGYIAQRMLSAKDRKMCTSNFTFNVHIRNKTLAMDNNRTFIFSDISISDISNAFPGIDKSIIGNDIAYPAMLSFLPSGLLGLVLASLIAAFMSTISSHLNWGASYVSIDFYKRFVKVNTTKKKLFCWKNITVLLMFLAGVIALELSDALNAFQILLQIGAGTGSIFTQMVL